MYSLLLFLLNLITIILTNKHLHKLYLYIHVFVHNFAVGSYAKISDHMPKVTCCQFSVRKYTLWHIFSFSLGNCSEIQRYLLEISPGKCIFQLSGEPKPQNFSRRRQPWWRLKELTSSKSCDHHHHMI